MKKILIFILLFIILNSCGVKNDPEYKESKYEILKNFV